MTVAEYLETVKTYLLTNPLVENFQIVRERMTGIFVSERDLSTVI